VQPTVVLIHGLFGFDQLLGLEYFGRVRRLYESMGLRVIVPRLPWVGTIEQRSAALSRRLADEKGPLHLVAHSMGGLDARAYISKLDGADKVASLTTLVTPHHGSAVADHVCRKLSPFRIFPAAHVLTRPHLAAFNASHPDVPGIRYRSYGAARPLHELPWIVRHYARILQSDEGDNDAQVSVQSAQWGEYVETLPADHFELIGRNFWFNPFRRRQRFDHLPVYRAIGEWVLQQDENQSR